MSENGRSASDDVLAAAVATGVPLKEAAERAQISLRTVTRRLGDPEFMAKVKAIRNRIIDEGVGQLADRLAKAVGILTELTEPQSEGIQLKAANSLIDRLVKVRSHAELEERLDDLERRLEEQEARP